MAERLRVRRGRATLQPKQCVQIGYAVDLSQRIVEPRDGGIKLWCRVAVVLGIADDQPPTGAQLLGDELLGQAKAERGVAVTAMLGQTNEHIARLWRNELATVATRG